MNRTNRTFPAFLLSCLLLYSCGSGSDGGSANTTNENIEGLEIFSTGNAFALLYPNGSVVTWGDPSHGGDSSGVDFSSGVVEIFSTNQAFAAIKSDGSVVTWGDPNRGEDSSGVDLSSDVVEIFSTSQAFAAMKNDGAVVTWGASNEGGGGTSVASELTSGVETLIGGGRNFIALKGGKAIEWGSDWSGLCDPAVYFSSVSSELTSGVTDIFTNGSGNAFAAVKSDGSVLTWGGS